MKEKYLLTYTANNGEDCRSLETLASLARKIEYAKRLGYKNIYVYEIRREEIVKRYWDMTYGILTLLNIHDVTVETYTIKKEA